MVVGRAFVAVVPPAAALDAVVPVAEAVRNRLDAAARDARWTGRHQWHLTLQFLGNHVDLDAAGAALATVRVTAADVQLGGTGAFPDARRARVLWLGVTRGDECLTAAARAVGAALAPTGFVPDARPFHPHLTLARLGRPSDLRDVIDERGPSRTPPVGPAWHVREIVLFRSVTAREGARYTVVATVPTLSAAEGA